MKKYWKCVIFDFGIFVKKKDLFVKLFSKFMRYLCRNWSVSKLTLQKTPCVLTWTLFYTWSNIVSFNAFFFSIHIRWLSFASTLCLWVIFLLVWIYYNESSWFAQLLALVSWFISWCWSLRVIYLLVWIYYNESDWFEQLLALVWFIHNVAVFQEVEYFVSPLIKQLSWQFFQILLKYGCCADII